MLKAYRVRNLRCISDSTFLEIKPIIVFVGKNSSGKSTLLRLMPLIKQSISEETREPILWYGRSVDFGSFEEAVSRHSGQDEIILDFRFDMTQISGHEIMRTEGGEEIIFSIGDSRRVFVSNEPKTVEVSITMGGRSDSEGAYTKAIEVRTGSDTLRLVANENGELREPIFNGKQLRHAPKVDFRFVSGRFFPTLLLNSKDNSPEELRRSQVFGFHGEGPYFEPLVERLRPFAHGNTQQSTLRKLAEKIEFGPPEEFLAHISALFKKSRLKGIGSGLWDQNVEELRAHTFLRHVPRILREASGQLIELGSGVRYLEPIRARAARYYRFQELAIDELDPQGENLPMFLSSLSYEDRRSLEQWMTEAMGFQVRASREGGHVKLMINETGSSREINMADTGFGYSQVLPIVLQLWKVERDAKQSRRRTRRRLGRQVVAVEQPELHLHPELQALLADVFALSVNAARGASASLSVMIETHSEHLVNRLGTLVERGILSKDDVSVYLVQRETIDDSATVLKAAFSEDGVLSEPWPLGFFSPQLELPKPHVDRD